METIEDIAYAPEHGLRGLGDLLLPEKPERAPMALCIHGGGWNAMDNYSWAGVAQLMCEQGFAAYNINYRLLDQAPWPACGDDCLRAANFFFERQHPAMKQLDPSEGLVIIGGSAGGHLAMMTGLRLPRERVRAIVSIAGPADLLYRAERTGREFFRDTFFRTSGEVTDRMLLEASPVSYVKPKSPPLLCVHSVNDKLVTIDQSRRIVEMYKGVRARAELFAFRGPGEQHGIWIEGSDPHRLLPEPANAVCTFLKTV